MSDQNITGQLNLLNMQLQELIEFNKTQFFNLHSNWQVSTVWIPRPVVMKFFGYQDTQMSTLASKSLVSTKVGAKTFYHRESIEKLLESNVQSSESQAV